MSWVEVSPNAWQDVRFEITDCRLKPLRSAPGRFLLRSFTVSSNDVRARPLLLTPSPIWGEGGQESAQAKLQTPSPRKERGWGEVALALLTINLAILKTERRS